MKKKLLFCILLLMTLLVSCGGKNDEEKSAREKIGILESLKREENIASKNLDKYNSYLDLYNEISTSNPIISFYDEYIKTFYDESGNFRKEKGRVFNTFGSGIEAKFILFDRKLNETKDYMNQKPKYDFDNDVEKLIEICFKLKEKILNIINYYKNGFYEDDDYVKGEKMEEEYYTLLTDYSKHIENFFDGMDKLQDENNRALLKEFKKNGEVVRLNMLKFKIVVEEYIDILYDREEIVFSDEDIKELKEVNNRLIKELENVEATTDKQLEKEHIFKDEFRNSFVKSAEELVEFSTSLISLLEKNQDVKERINKFERAYSKFMNAYEALR